jgi:hypothetical protein
MQRFLKPHCKTLFVDLEKTFSASKLKGSQAGPRGRNQQDCWKDKIYWISIFSDLMSRAKKMVWIAGFMKYIHVFYPAGRLKGSR